MALKSRKKDGRLLHNKLIDPSKLYRMLEKLKRNGNPYYTFYNDAKQYQARCRREDPDGYQTLFDDLEEEVVVMDSQGFVVDDELEKMVSSNPGLTDGEDISEDEEQKVDQDPTTKYHCDL